MLKKFQPIPDAESVPVWVMILVSVSCVPLLAGDEILEQLLSP